MATPNHLENLSKRNRLHRSLFFYFRIISKSYLISERNKAKSVVVSSDGAGAALVRDVASNAKNKKTIPKPNVK